MLFFCKNLKNTADNKDREILTTGCVHLNAKGNKLVGDEMWNGYKGSQIVKSVG